MSEQEELRNAVGVMVDRPFAEQLRVIVDGGQYTFLPSEDRSVLTVAQSDVEVRKIITVLQAVSESSAARTAVAREWKVFAARPLKDLRAQIDLIEEAGDHVQAVDEENHALRRRAEAAEADWQAAETKLIAARQESAGWRCFWCNKLFTNRGEAELHFGAPHSGRMRPECARVFMPTNSTGQVGGSRNGASASIPRGKQPAPVEPAAEAKGGYNAGARTATIKRLLGPVERQRLGRAPPWVRSMAEMLFGEAKQLAARLAAAERDVRRLDWLNANACAKQYVCGGALLWTFETPDSEDAAVRAAIDAALSKEPRNG